MEIKHISIKQIYIYIYTWNPTDPCFDRKRPYFGWLVVQNRGHSGSRYIYQVKIKESAGRGGRHLGTWPELKPIRFRACKIRAFPKHSMYAIFAYIGVVLGSM